MLTLSILAAAAVLAFDYMMPLGVAAAVPYAVFVLLSLWLPGRWTPLVFAGAGTVLTVLGLLLSPPSPEGMASIVVTNRALALVAIWVAAGLCQLQRAAMTSLADSETRLRALIDTATDAVVVIDEAGIIRRVNPATERLFGYTAEELVGNNVSMLMPSPDRERHDEYLAHYLATGEPRIIGIGREVEARHRDGTTFPIRLAVGEAKLHGRRLFTGMIHDLTHERRTEQQLEDLQSELFRVSRVTELGAMTSAIAHETNQPLTAVSTYLYTLKRVLKPGAEAPETAVAMLDKALEQTERATQVIRNIREMTRNRDPGRQPERVNDIVRDALEVALLGTRRLELELRVELDDGLPHCPVNRTQIQQVVLNLVRNGAEAVADSPTRRLVVATRATEDDEVLIEVADTGPGLREEVRERLFQPFVTTKADGVGIGLSICRSIVTQHGGRLWAEPNPAPEGGTVFRFALPTEESARDAQRQSV